MSGYLRFDRMVPQDKRTTEVYTVVNALRGITTGAIGWERRWRQYCFYPEDDTVFSAGCLGEVVTFLEGLQRSWRIARKESKS